MVGSTLGSGDGVGAGRPQADRPRGDVRPTVSPPSPGRGGAGRTGGAVAGAGAPLPRRPEALLDGSARKSRRNTVVMDTIARLMSMSPDFGPAGGGTRVVIRGSGLGDVRQVYFGRAAAPWVDTRSEGRLVVLTPRADQPGAVTVTLRSPHQRTRLPQRFTYTWWGVTDWF
jgi:hypothetical protein